MSAEERWRERLLGVMRSLEESVDEHLWRLVETAVTSPECDELCLDTMISVLGELLYALAAIREAEETILHPRRERTTLELAEALRRIAEEASRSGRRQLARRIWERITQLLEEYAKA